MCTTPPQLCWRHQGQFEDVIDSTRCVLVGLPSEIGERQGTERVSDGSAGTKVICVLREIGDDIALF